MFLQCACDGLPKCAVCAFVRKEMKLNLSEWYLTLSLFVFYLIHKVTGNQEISEWKKSVYLNVLRVFILSVCCSPIWVFHIFYSTKMVGLLYFVVTATLYVHGRARWNNVVSEVELNVVRTRSKWKRLKEKQHQYFFELVGKSTFWTIFGGRMSSSAQKMWNVNPRPLMDFIIRRKTLNPESASFLLTLIEEVAHRNPNSLRTILLKFCVFERDEETLQILQCGMDALHGRGVLPTTVVLTFVSPEYTQ